jgi:hypothetical protein
MIERPSEEGRARARAALRAMEATMERMRDNRTNVISLPSYNVEKRGQYWYYWRAAFFSSESPKGPYGSAMSVCMMIARELVLEVTSNRRKK